MDSRILKLRRGVEKLESWVSSLEEQVGGSTFLSAEDSLSQVSGLYCSYNKTTLKTYLVNISYTYIVQYMCSHSEKK